MTDPRQTANDLRTAAHVIEVAGHTTGGEIDTDTGKVCLLGAIGIATGVYGIATAQDLPDLCFYAKSLTAHIYTPQLTNYRPARMPDRVRACVEAIAPHLPVEDPEDTETAIVWRWNDVSCDGGEDAILLLTQVAEKLEADL